jgi:hypothetical protein
VRRSSAVVVLAASLALAACGGGESSVDTVVAATTAAPASTVAATTTAAPATTTTTEPVPVPTAPLTGAPVVDEAALDRPALIVKIDNAPGAWPQTGLNQADIVYEENVEGWTRFAAVFHSQGSDPVGPVRSGRTQDISLGTSLDRPLLVWSGGNATVTSLINRSDLVNMSVSAAGPNGGYYRSSDMRAPHNLFTRTSSIWALDEGRGGRPGPQFDYRASDEPADGTAVTGVKLRMDGSMRASWEWNASDGVFERTHDREPHLLSDGSQVSAHNVLILECEYKTSVADSRSPEAQTTGSGRAWIFTDGLLIEGTWSRPDQQSPWTLATDAGAVIALSPGRTWVSLVREGQAVVVPAGQAISDVDWP